MTLPLHDNLGSLHYKLTGDAVAGLSPAACSTSARTAASMIHVDGGVARRPGKTGRAHCRRTGPSLLRPLMHQALGSTREELEVVQPSRDA